MLNCFSRKNCIRFFVLFMSALIIRLIFFYIFLAQNPCQLMYDSKQYHDLAVNLVEGKGIVGDDGVTPQFYRLPGYSCFLALCYKIFGINPQAALFAQVVLSSVIPLLVFFLALALFPLQCSIAFLAASIATIHTGLLIFSGLVMSETLFLIFFLLFLILFFSLINSHQKTISWHVLLAGFFLGCVSLIRPVGHYLGIVAVFLLLLSSEIMHEKIKKIVWGSMGWVVVVGPWLLRNYLLTGYIFFHTLSGGHFLHHSATRIVFATQAITYQQACQQVDEDFEQIKKENEERFKRPLFEIESTILAEKLTLKYMLKNPLATLKHGVSNMLKTMFSLYSSELLMIDAGGQLPAYGTSRSLFDLFKKFLFPQVMSKKIIPVIYFELTLFIFLLIGFAGFLLKALCVNKDLLLVFTILVYMSLFIFLSLACGYARLRLPAEILLIVGTSKFWAKSNSNDD
jgi:hypothetical protein